MANYYLFELASPQHLHYSFQKRKELKFYLNEIWRFQPSWNSIEASFSERQPFVQLQEKTIRNTHFAGIISFEGDIFYLIPKLFPHTQSVDISLIFNHLWYYLSYTSRTHFAWQIAEWDTSEAHLEGMDVWFFAWVSIVAQILEGYTYKKFEQELSPSQQCKGKIVWMPYTQTNLPKAKWHILYNDFQHFTENNTLNQLLQYVTSLIPSFTQNLVILDKVERILHHLSGVSLRSFTYQEACTIQINRLQTEYVWILEMCKVWLSNEWINKELGLAHNFSFLFQMDRLYEEFIAGFISYHFPEIIVQSQAIDFLAKTKIGEKPVFQIKNDLYLPEKNLIIDTKYKIRNTPKKRKVGVDEKDVYQILSYGIAKDCQNLCLLYPTQLGTKIENPLTEWVISGKLLNFQKIQVSAFDLDICTNTIKNMGEVLDSKIKMQLQKILAE